MSHPLVSICIPSYNYGRFIADAVDSALAQTHPNIEVVVSDNGSVDETFEVLQRYAADARVRVFRNETNIGITPNFNAAIRRSRGEYIVTLSADDKIFPEHVSMLLARMSDLSDPVDVVYSGALLCDSMLRPMRFRALPGQIPMKHSGRNELGDLLISCLVCMPTMLVRRADLDELGFLDERFKVASDWEHAVRLSRAGKRFGYLPEAYTAVRFHGDQASGIANYFSKGHDLGEWLMILDDTIVDEYAWRFNGYERTLARRLISRVEQLQAEGLVAEEHVAKAGEIIGRLTAYAHRRPARPASEPRVSVVIPTNGRAVFLEEALASLAAQTYDSWEAVIVQAHGSSLGPWIRSLPHAEKLRFVYREVPGTPGEIRNLGIALARGECIAFLDDDNRYTPEHLERLVEALDRDGLDVAVSGATLVVDRFDPDEICSRVEHRRKRNLYPGDCPNARLTVANAVALNSVLVRRAAIDKVGPFQEDMHLLEDWEFILRVLGASPYAFCAFETVEVHQHLDMRHQRLGSHAGSYLMLLDYLYAKYPHPSPEVTMLRMNHRELVQQIVDEYSPRAADAETLEDLLSVLAGEYLSSLNQAESPTAEADLAGVR